MVAKYISKEVMEVLGSGINKWYQSFALRNFDLEDMEFESTNNGTTAKLPILKLENGDSWVSVPQTAQENGTSVTKMSIPITAGEKTNLKNELPMKLTLIVHKFVLLAICYAASPPVYIPACEQIHENDLEQCIEVAALFATCEGKEVLRKAKKECRALKCKEGQLKIKTTPGSKQTMKRNLQGKLLAFDV
ncbi:hypothetical protein Tco_1183517 [Tanacetum coccineum]